MPRTSRFWVASILRRPLFSPNRHPAAVTTASGSGLPRLTGIIITPSDKRALFAAPDGRTLISLGEGGRLGAYTMQLIEAGQITIDGPSGTRVLHPAFKSAQEEQTATNVPPTPPFPPPRPPMPWSSRNRAAR